MTGSTPTAGASTQTTNWVVITGPPSAGKTSVIHALQQRGHNVVAETARHYIASLGRSPSEIAADASLQRRIQHGISALQHEIEDGLEPAETLFLDRALPDSLAYFHQLGLSTDDLMQRAARFRYRHVFFLEALPFADDGLRFERANEAEALADRLIAAYAGLGYAPIRVPVFEHLEPEASVAERVALILGRSMA